MAWIVKIGLRGVYGLEKYLIMEEVGRDADKERHQTYPFDL